MRKQRKISVGVGLLLLIVCLNGCSQNTGNKEIAESSEPAAQTSSVLNHTDKQTPELRTVMDRITGKQGLNNALDYEKTADGVTDDAIVRLCQSPSGKYTAYGFISPEYGKKGILIDNIIEDESNWNYFEENWCYGDVQPALEENGEYEVTFTFVQEENGNNHVREICYDTYDTGTMSERE